MEQKAQGPLLVTSATARSSIIFVESKLSYSVGGTHLIFLLRQVVQGRLVLVLRGEGVVGDLMPSPLPGPTEQPEAVCCVGDIPFSFTFLLWRMCVCDAVVRDAF